MPSQLKTFLDNRGEDARYAKYLARHKYLVYKNGRTLGVPRIQLLKHDLDKLLPSEWVPYRERFFSKTPITKEQADAFRVAVARHKARNAHHQGLTPYESIADWYATGEKKSIPFKEWVKSNMNNLPGDKRRLSNV